jgi:hypothetical protein
VAVGLVPGAKPPVYTPTPTRELKEGSEANTPVPVCPVPPNVAPNSNAPPRGAESSEPNDYEQSADLFVDRLLAEARGPESLRQDRLFAFRVGPPPKMMWDALTKEQGNGMLGLFSL